MSQDIATSTIIGQAFDLMEIQPPSSFGDDSAEARAARSRFAIARDMTLESYDWSAARKVAVLSPAKPENVTPDPHLPFTHVLPSDCLRLLTIYDAPHRWRQDGRYIRSDADGILTIRYTRRPERETDLPALVQTAIALQLAVLLAPRFVESRTKKADLRDALVDAVETAKRHDAFSASAHSMDGSVPDGCWVAEARR